MFIWLRAVRVLAVSATVAAGLAAGISPAHAASNVRYASVQGVVTGDCPINDPCYINAAVNNAPTGSTVIVEPGTYGDGVDLTANNVNIHGEAGQPRPFLVSNAATAVALTNGSELSDVTVLNSVGVALSADATSGAVGVIAETTQGGGVTCEVLGYLTDSVCAASGLVGTGDSISTTSTITPTLNGDTIVAPAFGLGLLLDEDSANTLDINITNSIVEGGKYDIYQTEESGGEKYDAFLFNSDSKSFHPDPGVPPSDSQVTRNSTDIETPADFVDPNSLDYAEKPDSATINKGEPEPSITTDVLGEPRKSGSAPDMGALEFQQKPTATGLKITKRGAHSATANLKVNPESEATTVELFAVHGHTTVSSKVTSAGQGSAAKTEKLTISGLVNHTSYTVYAVATNRVGSTRSAKKKISTPKK